MANEQQRKAGRQASNQSEAGRKGGESVSRDRSHMADIGRKGGKASGGGSR